MSQAVPGHILQSLDETRDRRRMPPAGHGCQAHFAPHFRLDQGSRLARAFGAERTPEAFLFDASGKLVYHGTIDDNAQSPGEVKERYLRDALQALVDGNKIAVAETKSLGCTIKLYK